MRCVAPSIAGVKGSLGSSHRQSPRQFSSPFSPCLVVQWWSESSLLKRHQRPHAPSSTDKRCQGGRQEGGICNGIFSKAIANHTLLNHLQSHLYNLFNRKIGLFSQNTDHNLCRRSRRKAQHCQCTDGFILDSCINSRRPRLTTYM